jgi:type IX secretion system PorP/SprF family membrane protein
LLHNPSLAGVQQDENIKGMMGASYRQQWSGISGAPQTVTVFGSFQLPKQKIGIGGYLYNDKTGPTSRTGIQLSLAKHIIFNDGGIFSLGIESRFQQYAIDRAKLSESIANDPVLGASDNRFKYDAGFGMSYTNKQWQLGASVSQLVQSKLDFYSGNLTTTEEARLYRQYYLMGSYNWRTDEDNVIVPNFLVKLSSNAPADIEAGARIEHKDFIWVGFNCHYQQSFSAFAGLKMNHKYAIGYAYDQYRTPLSIFDNGGGAHEISLRYYFSPKK